uniref:Prefoldin subunit 3 n=1 Tax=Fibrocapsa japonica TaxID=94617 RepID=A0A7S2Y0F3_9STRA|mmetsp:Transcript_19016/g.27422  ORF Transcript_19016/g.27422 Transcript_19016/m.27422 type:complete len:206 (+) Transcript_19016:81-698(+)|eukprot:CAMPEP_0113945114 /NCGR_PEP_ID=MMETSP1339-20121228/38493_1 /TAXON_ID=94617 /ORGANISM="Fibrocapsa japonica" /LENGTH=205 /DNA_ID=CAMNT_0000950523 /DNA_START=78 /DNA_END=695 /DNA_ORIENTATION=+ /assembly_acc=CAM_ASM_000762
MAEVAEGTVAAEAKNIDVQNQLTKGSNPRGIPGAIFIEDVENFVNDIDHPIETIIGAFNELHRKYKFMESQQIQHKASYMQKVPEIERAISLVKYLVENKESEEDVIATYSLADTVYAKAKIEHQQGKVCLWLGANVMVEYTYDEALTLLEANLQKAKEKRATTTEDLEFLRNQVITVEVNMARVFNHNVKLRRLLAEASGEERK